MDTETLEVIQQANGYFVIDDKKFVSEPFDNECDACHFIALAQQFNEMVAKHDLTYQYSDDHRWWKAGQASITRIREAMQQLPDELTHAIWNTHVDRKLADGKEQFYWKGNNHIG